MFQRFKNIWYAKCVFFWGGGWELLQYILLETSLNFTRTLKLNSLQRKANNSTAPFQCLTGPPLKELTAFHSSTNMQ